jgi:hypothetical protein
MFTMNNLLREINDLPADRLEEVYQFVHSIKKEKKGIKSNRTKVLSFAGMFGDMTRAEYSEFKKGIKETRQNSFNRNVDI